MGFLLPATVFLVIASTMMGVSNAHGRQPLCNIRIHMCSADMATILAELETRPDIDSACARVQQIHACMGDCATDILGDSKLANAVTKVLDYMCEPARREHVTSISELQCFQDMSFEKSFEREASACSNDASDKMTRVFTQTSGMAAIARVCSIVREAISCVSEKVADICGDEVTTFVEDIMKIVVREMTAGQLPNCIGSVSATHHAIRRAVQVVKMMYRK